MRIQVVDLSRRCTTFGWKKDGCIHPLANLRCSRSDPRVKAQKSCCRRALARGFRPLVEGVGVGWRGEREIESLAPVLSRESDRYGGRREGEKPTSSYRTVFRVGRAADRRRSCGRPDSTSLDKDARAQGHKADLIPEKGHKGGLKTKQKGKESSKYVILLNSY